jgi:hypothetical protein
MTIDSLKFAMKIQFYGRLAPDRRISVYKKKRPERSAYQMDEVYAWDQPNIHLSLSLWTPCNSVQDLVFEEALAAKKLTMLFAALAEAWPP